MNNYSQYYKNIIYKKFDDAGTEVYPINFNSMVSVWYVWATKPELV